MNAIVVWISHSFGFTFVWRGGDARAGRMERAGGRAVAREDVRVIQFAHGSRGWDWLHGNGKEKGKDV